MYAMANRAISNTQDRDFCMNLLISVINMKNKASLVAGVKSIKERIEMDKRWDVENEKFYTHMF
jgi:hypothetical protein